MYPFLPVRALCKFSYDTKSIVADIDAPLLVVHSRDDDLVPFHHGEALRDARRGRTDFLEIRGDHNYGWSDSGRLYTDGLERFIAAAMGELPSSDRTSGR